MTLSKHFKLIGVKGQKIILNALCCTLFFVHIIIAGLMLGGTVDSFGAPITVVVAVDLVVNIVNISRGAIMAYLLNAVLGIVYVVAMVVVIQSVISSISCFFDVVFKKKDSLKLESQVMSLISKFGETLKYCLIFMMLAVMTSADYQINASGIAVLVMGAVVYVGICVAWAYLKNYKWDCILYRACCTVLVLLTYILMIALLQMPTFEQIVYGFTVLFGGYFGTFTSQAIFTLCKLIAMPILYCILQFFLFGFIEDVWGIDFYLDSGPAMDTASRVMGMAIAVVIVSLVINMILGNLGTVSVEQIFEIIKKDLPLLLAGITFFVCFKFADYKVLNKVVSKHPPETSPVKEVQRETLKQTEICEKAVVEKEIEVAVTKPVEEPEKSSETNENNIEMLKKYKDLLDSGIITQEEFNVKKKQLLDL